MSFRSFIDKDNVVHILYFTKNNKKIFYTFCRKNIHKNNKQLFFSSKQLFNNVCNKCSHHWKIYNKLHLDLRSFLIEELHYKLNDIKHHNIRLDMIYLKSKNKKFNLKYYEKYKK